jgi:hypothetical protein
VNAFEEKLARGKLGEKLVAEHLKGRGWGVVPSYDYSGAGDDKSPRLSFSAFSLVIPDLDLCQAGTRMWLEIKTYHGPAFNRTRQWDVHGIPSRLRNHYLKVQEQTGTRVHLAVLEVDSGALLTSWLDLLSAKSDPCMCRGCRSGGRCAAPHGIKAGIYWPRSMMKIVHTFADDGMAEIRAALEGSSVMAGAPGAPVPR